MKVLPAFGNENDGTNFEWLAGKKDGDLKKIEGEAGEYINKIQFSLTNGEASPSFGGAGGEAYSHVVPEG